jgi:hypothetical protein
MNRHQRRAAQAKARKRTGYLHRVMAAASIDRLRGKVAMGVIAHDDWCGIYTATCTCTCTPDTSIHPIDGGDVVVIDADGDAKDVKPS